MISSRQHSSYRYLTFGRIVSAFLLIAAIPSASGQSASESANAGNAPSDNSPAEFTTPLQVLELLGIGESELAQFGQGDAFSDDEFLVLHRLLARLPRFPRKRLTAWQRTDVNWSDTKSDGSELPATIVRVSGKMRQLTREELPVAIADRVRYTHFYRAVIVDAYQPVEYTVFLRRIPIAFVKHLKSGTPIVENVAVTGLFLKSGESLSATVVAKRAISDAKERQPIYLAADLLEWFPDDPNSDLVRNKPEYVKLAEFGMDVGVLGTVKDRKPLIIDDREGFYQMLATIGQQPVFDVRAMCAPTDATELLQDPLSHRGRFYSMNGTARRAIRIQVKDPDIVERFGITHYYEIEVFDHTANVRVKDRKDADRAAVYHSYPVVFCTRTIPEGFPTGDLIHENVQINGAYLKLWAYATRFIHTQIGESDGPPPMQISPMIIGPSPLFLNPPVNDPRIGLGAGLGFIAAVLGLWGLVVWFNRGDAKFRRETIDRHVNQEWEVPSEEDESVKDALAELKTSFSKRKLGDSDG